VVHNYIDAAALAANMDVVITDNEAMAHIAGALDRTVLYVPGAASPKEPIDIATGYRDLTVFQQGDETPASDLLLRVSLALLLKLVSSPFDEGSSDEERGRPGDKGQLL